MSLKSAIASGFKLILEQPEVSFELEMFRKQYGNCDERQFWASCENFNHDFKDSNQHYVYFHYAVFVILGFTGKRDLRDPSSVQKIDLQVGFFGSIWYACLHRLEKSPSPSLHLLLGQTGSEMVIIIKVPFQLLVWKHLMLRGGGQRGSLKHLIQRSARSVPLPAFESTLKEKVLVGGGSHSNSQPPTLPPFVPLPNSSFCSRSLRQGLH